VIQDNTSEEQYRMQLDKLSRWMDEKSYSPVPYGAKRTKLQPQTMEDIAKVRLWHDLVHKLKMGYLLNPNRFLNLQKRIPRQPQKPNWEIEGF
jgi:hypothetical protein